MTSLVDKVDALRRFFGKSFAELDLIPAVAAMNAAMSLVGSGSLTAQVDTLVASTGVRVASPPAPAEIPAAASAAASGGASSTAAGKKRARSPAAQQATSTANLGTPTGKRAQKLTDFTGFTKLLIRKTDLVTVAKRQVVGEAVPYEEVEKEVLLELSGMLPSERAAPLPAAWWFCDDCNRGFSTAIGLRNHSMWHEMKQPGQRVDEPIKRKPFDGTLTAALAVGGGGVAVTLLVNGKDRAQIEREAVEHLAAMATAKAEREAEHARRAAKRLRDKEAKVAEAEGEQRRGSARRIQHSSKEKLKVLDIFDKVVAEAPANKKVEVFEDNPRSLGVRYNLASKWAKPQARRDIRWGASQQHAAALMRIDKTSRKTGKYAPMEKILYTRFTARRARARKCSPKWFVHTAKHIMRSDFPDDAAAFRGSRSWLRRFFSRKRLVRRKKTNNKNTTWEETKPALQRYFRAFRRRLRDTPWRTARGAARAEAEGEAEGEEGSEGTEARARMRGVWEAETAATEPADPAASPTAANATEPAAAASRKRSRDEEATAAAAKEQCLPWWQRGRAKWGKYLPHERFNVDQVRQIHPHAQS
jgi:hypothetical protein